ncbi:MAG: ATP-binding protein, partial [Pseudomonadota bacterium]
FEPFYTTKDLGASKGLGLGMALSFGIVESFGGRLTCRNTATDGASFSLQLPLMEPDE